MPLILGHRGDYAGPENSLLAFRHALDVADGIEFDVQLSKDLIPIVIHDDTLDRTTNAKGKVSDYKARILKTFHLRDRDGNLSAERIPTLEDVLLLARCYLERIPVLNIEIKDQDATEPVLDLLDDYVTKSCSLCQRMIISSFHHDVLKMIRRKVPSTFRLGLLFEDTELMHLEELVQSIKPDFIHPSARQLPKIRKLIEKHQLAVACWMVDEKTQGDAKRQFQEITSLGRLDMVISNFPVTLFSSKA